MVARRYEFYFLVVKTNNVQMIKKCSNAVDYSGQLACVASVPVQSERKRVIRAARKMGREQKTRKEGGGGEERRERLPANPWI